MNSTYIGGIQSFIATKSIEMMRYAFAILLPLFSVQTGFAQKGPELLVLCRSAKVVRTLRIERTRNQSCQSIYTKAGVDKNIGNSVKIENCLEYLNKIRIILEKANWSCKDIKDSTVSTLIDNVN